MAVTASESMQKFSARFRGQGKKLFLVGMGVLLAIRVLIYLMEAGWSGPEMVEPQVIKLEPKITTDSMTYTLVSNVTKPAPPFQESPYKALASNNMFDPKRVLDAAEYEKRANEFYSDALVLFQQGSLEEARKRVDDALSLQGNHLKAKELRKQINDRLGIAEQPTLKDIETVAPTTATATVTAPPVAPAGAAPGAAGPAGVPPGAPPPAPGGAPPAPPGGQPGNPAAPPPAAQ